MALESGSRLGSYEILDQIGADGDKMMAATFSADPEPRPGRPTLLFEGRYRSYARSPSTNYDVSRINVIRGVRRE